MSHDRVNGRRSTPIVCPLHITLVGLVGIYNGNVRMTLGYASQGMLFHKVFSLLCSTCLVGPARVGGLLSVGGYTSGCQKETDIFTSGGELLC